MNGYHDAAHEDREARRRTLPSVALVCRAFTPYALDTIWCTLNKFQPLLSLLPAIYYDVDEDTYLLSRVVEPEEWQHFEEYTHRVRELHYDADYELKVHPSVWTHLQEHYGHSPMLPQLKKLDVMAVSPYCVSPLLLLLHPALRSLAIAFGRDMIISPPTAAMPPGAAVLEVVSGSSPDVHVLDLRHSFLMTMPAIGALADLRQLKKLVLCQCSQCSVSSCSPIWTVPLADSLRVCALAVKDIPDTFAPGSFRSLRELSVNGLPGDVVNFIRGIQPIALHTFNLIARRVPRTGQQQQNMSIWVAPRINVAARKHMGAIAIENFEGDDHDGSSHSFNRGQDSGLRG
ncbi:hypothetical protein OH76DRAFT_1487258 [Lentinus brumalis]|uniref:F-box domain-containing protein n=1 Tax=Lentinus brumalis TaxID=2498619 RepID=A0A371CV63_9APHY|nr:hypothetical protein OH76DRAFT_1487258 [Polyporus brumalis]